jgi:ABC-type multidrug transport system ATPase subunit
MMIQTQQLNKTYNDHRVVDDLTLEIQEGEIFGLLGPNAAGKSTTIRMLAGIVRPNSGSVYIDGKDLRKETDLVKKQIGYLSQHFGLYAELSVIENIRFYADIYGIDDDDRLIYLLSKYGLSSFADIRAEKLSGGYQRRLALACALVHDPKLLFLDEPTAGIDPVTRKRIWDIFYDLQSEGKTLFVTTHYMEEAERCSVIAFMNHGKIIAQGSPSTIHNALKDHDVYALRSPFDQQMLKVLDQNKDIVLLNQFGKVLRIMTKRSLKEDQLRSLIHPFIEGEILLQRSEANLEEVFIALTQEKEI